MSAPPHHERAVLRAWSALVGRRPAVERLDVLKEDPARTAVYRLHLRGETRLPVIAKRSPHDTASIERTAGR